MNTDQESKARIEAAAAEMFEALTEILDGAIPHKRDYLMTGYARNKAIAAIQKATQPLTAEPADKI